MGTRVHTTDASLVNLSVMDGEAIKATFGFDDDVEQALVIEDGGNQEAWVLIGSDNELLTFADDIRSKVARPRAVTTTTCRHCGRAIILNADDEWFDPEATGDDAVWRFTCDANDGTFRAEHEPKASEA